MHPYSNLPEMNFWRSAVASRAWPDIDFKPQVKFRIDGGKKIGAAGSCFAQHICKNLPIFGLNYFVTERAPFMLSQERAIELGYGVFSARYGNIYTVAQLRQLIEFAFEMRERTSIAEEVVGGGWVDLLRPGVQAEPYLYLEELEDDRLFHLNCVRNLFEQADCFIFTLGLTEHWYDLNTKVVFPICPGTRIGGFDEASHKFHNASFLEIKDDLDWCINFCKEINPQMTWIFTVSPVPLVATASMQHVLSATVAAKSTLRSVVEEVYQYYDNCEYFPSYEITSYVANRGEFIQSDMRTITEAGVALVMQQFQKSFGLETVEVVKGPAPPGELRANNSNTLDNRIEAAAKAECDEVFNDPT